MTWRRKIHQLASEYGDGLANFNCDFVFDIVMNSHEKTKALNRAFVNLRCFCKDGMLPLHLYFNISIAFDIIM